MALPLTAAAGSQPSEPGTNPGVKAHLEWEMKTIDDRYAEGHRGALFTVTTAEEAWKLGGLERFLTPAVREQLSSLQDLRYSCDNNMQLAHDALAMSRVAADYSELRRALFCDSTQHAEEPPWRVCQRNSLAMRIRPRLHRCAKAALVLSRDRRHVLTQAESWTFTTLANSHDPKDEGTAYPVTLYPFPKGDDQVKDEYLLDAPPSWKSMMSGIGSSSTLSLPWACRCGSGQSRTRMSNSE